ncbi:hypothetical protein GH741_11040 [Aquibacillus halophilus]|uniref:Uncharacterized protein n=1 Tax=Aquibacillus halophilus TaxID=930132 RepID=A0A6A8DBW4_9BACI|nr:hypothetical protein [Aquibacillus halophilus]MRH43215.1 hypothetical protein [Aquibacillus halophilus]
MFKLFKKEVKKKSSCCDIQFEEVEDDIQGTDEENRIEDCCSSDKDDS